MKKKKEDEIDNSTLPPWLPVSVSLVFNMTREKSQKIISDLNMSNFSMKKLIPKIELINFGKERGMYADPNQVNDKQKKDKNAGDIPTELTPTLLAKIFAAYYSELNLAGRKAKKERLDAIASGKDISQKKPDPKDTKKDTKKDSKGGKTEVISEEKKDEPPLDQTMPKALDYIYLFLDFPSTKEEFVELSKAGAGMDLVLQVNEKNIRSKSGLNQNIYQNDNKEDFEAQLKKKLEEFEQNFDKKIKEENKNGSGLSSEDNEFIKSNTAVPKAMQLARKESTKGDIIRNSVYNKIIACFDESLPIEENLRIITKSIYQHICQFSLCIVEYNEWIKDKKVIPFMAKKELSKIDSATDPNIVPSETAIIPPTPEPKLEAKDDKKQSRADLTKLNPVKTPAAAGKKGVIEEEKKEKPPEVVPEVKKEEEVKPFHRSEKELKIQNHYFYNRQLSTLKDDNVTPGIILEALLDQVTYINTDNPLSENNDMNEIQLMLSTFTEEINGLKSTIKAENKVQGLDDGTKGSPFHRIYDEADYIAKNALQNKLYNDESIEKREHLCFDKIQIPGIDRVMMPEKHVKPEKLRKAEKSQLNPFISIENTDFEKYIMIDMFEALMKEKESERNWDFGDRKYDERHSRNTLAQTLFKALLYDPEIAAKYSEKDDSLLLGIYFRNPPGRIMRKKWTNEWKVLPNLENWISYFKSNPKNLKNEFYYDIDYQTIGDVHEKIKYMYPADDGIFMCTEFKIAEDTLYNYRVLKENVVFGIKKPIDKENSFAEFWATFPNETRLLVEMEKENSQENFENKEEISDITQKKEDKYSCTFTLTLQNGLVVKFLANGDIFQTMPKQRLNISNKLFEEILTDGVDKQDKGEQEIHRIITGKATVIRYMQDGSIQILYANGNVAVNKRNGIWVTTNNKGFRKGRRIRDNTIIEYDPISCTRTIDPETGCNILIREDKVMVIIYPDGSRYTIHKDGTRFLTSVDGNTFIVEHEEYATVKVIFDRVKERMGTIIGSGGSFAFQGFDNIMERSHTGRVTETYLPDETKVIGYKEKRELEIYNQFETSDIHLIYLKDGSVCKVKSIGEVIMISASDRVALNQKGENRKENDIDYFLQLFGVPEERKGGVYTCELPKKCLWTKDDEGNTFCVYSTGEAEGNITVSLNLGANSENNEFGRTESPDIPDGDYIEEENKFLPPPEKIIPPRLFMITNTNNGIELLNDYQLRHYFRLKEQDLMCHKMIDDQVPGIPNCQSITFLTQYLTLEEAKKYLITVKIPKNVDMIPQSAIIKTEPTVIRYLFRNLLKYHEYDESKRQILKKDLEKYKTWQNNKIKERNDFGLKERSQEDREKEDAIQEKIINSRIPTKLNVV